MTPALYDELPQRKHCPQCYQVKTTVLSWLMIQARIPSQVETKAIIKYGGLDERNANSSMRVVTSISHDRQTFIRFCIYFNMNKTQLPPSRYTL